MTARRLFRRLAAVLFAALLASVAWAAVYAVFPPPVTPLMLIRKLADDADMDRRWVPLSAISPHLIRAVIASEDTKFCTHKGFDWAAIDEAWERRQDGDASRGGSTISNQTAKNAFLWPGRDWLRKGTEAWFTALIEALWGKRRIMEVYLNIIEWGDGTYGAEAAAQAFFDKPAARLTAREAALLAVVLPGPRLWQPNHPTAYVEQRAEVIRRRMAVVERADLAACALTR